MHQNFLHSPLYSRCVPTASSHLGAGLDKAPENGLVPRPEYLLEDAGVVAAKRMRRLPQLETGTGAEQRRPRPLQLNYYRRCRADDDARKWMLGLLQTGRSWLRVRWCTEVGKRSRRRKG